MTSARQAFLWLALVTLFPQLLFAQGLYDQASTCEALALVLRHSEQPAPRDLAPAVNCVEEGPAAVAAAWSYTRSADDAAVLAQLARQLRDRRVFDATSRAAADASLPVEMRVHAIAVMMAHASVPVFHKRSKDGRIELELGGEVHHEAPVRGAEPLADSVASTAARILYHVVRDEPDSVVRRVARRATEMLLNLADRHALVEVVVLKMESVCEGRLRITNHMPIGLSFRVRTKHDRFLRDAWINAQRSYVLEIVDDGPFTLEASGRTFETVESRGPCSVEQRRSG